MPLPGDRENPIPTPRTEGGYTVTIRDNTSGEVRNLEFEDAWDEFTEFAWCEGNDACDGNRAQRFARAIGQDPPAGYHDACTQERFAVLVRSKATGEELYRDGEWDDESNCSSTAIEE